VMFTLKQSLIIFVRI